MYVALPNLCRVLCSLHASLIRSLPSFRSVSGSPTPPFAWLGFYFVFSTTPTRPLASLKLSPNPTIHPNDTTQLQISSRILLSFSLILQIPGSISILSILLADFCHPLDLRVSTIFRSLAAAPVSTLSPLLPTRPRENSCLRISCFLNILWFPQSFFFFLFTYSYPPSRHNVFPYPDPDRLDHVALPARRSLQ